MARKERKHNIVTQVNQTFQSNFQEPNKSVQRSHLQWTDYSDGGTMPRYRQRIELGLQATTPFQAEMSSVQFRDGWALYEYMTNNNPATGYRFRERTGPLFYQIGIPSVPHSSDLAAAENIAREKFYAKYRSTQTAFQGGVALGELRETLRMLRSPAKALRKRVGNLYDRILKNKGKAGKSTESRNRYLSETWLEHSFGWTPLISDIKDAHSLLENRKDYLDRNLVVITGFHSVSTETVSAGPGFGAGFLQYVSRKKLTETSEVKYRGAIKCSTAQPYTSPSRLWGFSPDNIIPTVWELIPYSFLIDYFTNIGKVLDAWSIRRCHLSWGARTERQFGILQLVDARSTDNLDVFKILRREFSPGDWRSESKRVNRQPINSVPIPDFRFKLPGYSTQWLNLAALSRVRASKF